MFILLIFFKTQKFLVYLFLSIAKGWLIACKNFVAMIKSHSILTGGNECMFLF
jgi:hypothetical protein